MKGLNKKFRSINKDTNVLSFENQDISRSHTKDLGDVAISYQYVVEEAISKQIKLNDHIAHMFIHGVFHILGYDHENNQDAEKMELKEIEFLSKLNIINPYNI
jgi:probable rRNA maturation factor